MKESKQVLIKYQGEDLQEISQVLGLAILILVSPLLCLWQYERYLA
jgi:hypothetical protein